MATINSLLKNELNLIYGDSDPEVASGGEFFADSTSISISFYTSATEKHYQERNGHVTRYGGSGTVNVEFKKIEDFLSE